MYSNPTFINSEEKKCFHCEIIKPLIDYKTKKAIQCKSCYAEKRKERRKKPEYINQERDSFICRYLRRKYGITIEKYDQMLVRQKGCCAICNLPETAIDKRTKNLKQLAVDHCHKTLKIRGLLCMRCNQAIGLLKDNIEIIQNAIKYLTNDR